MYQIAQLLEIPGQITDATISALYSGLRGGGSSASSGAAVKVQREHRQLFSTANRVPGVAAALRRESMPTAGVSRVQMIANREASSQQSTPQKPLSYLRESSAPPTQKSRESSRNRGSPRGSRDSSPRLPRPRYAIIFVFALNLKLSG